MRELRASEKITYAERVYQNVFPFVRMYQGFCLGVFLDPTGPQLSLAFDHARRDFRVLGGLVVDWSVYLSDA